MVFGMGILFDLSSIAERIVIGAPLFDVDVL